MRLALLVSCLLLLPATGLAAGKLYKWTDAQGVTHYTDEPPPDQQPYETRPVQGRPAAEPVAGIAPAEESENCRLVRKNITTLEGEGDIRMDLDGDGGTGCGASRARRPARLAAARRGRGRYLVVGAGVAPGRMARGAEARPARRPCLPRVRPGGVPLARRGWRAARHRQAARRPRLRASPDRPGHQHRPV